MKRLTILTLAILMIALFTGGNGFAQGNELQFTGTHYYGNTPRVFKLDQGQLIIQFETLGVRVNDNGDGPFHEAAVHIVGTMYSSKEGAKLRAFETWTDRDGDKLVWELFEKASKAAPPGVFPGSAKVVSGTGKYVGMQGSMDWMLKNPKSFPEDTGRGICSEKVRLLPSQ